MRRMYVHNFIPCWDVYAQADICQLGLDQRKVNMLAREYCAATKRKFKPVILSHGMLPGLLQVRHAAETAAGGVLTQPPTKRGSSVKNVHPRLIP